MKRFPVLINSLVRQGDFLIASLDILRKISGVLYASLFEKASPQEASANSTLNVSIFVYSMYGTLDF